MVKPLAALHRVVIAVDAEEALAEALQWQRAFEHSSQEHHVDARHATDDHVVARALCWPAHRACGDDFHAPPRLLHHLVAHHLHRCLFLFTSSSSIILFIGASFITNTIFVVPRSIEDSGVFILPTSTVSMLTIALTIIIVNTLTASIVLLIGTIGSISNINK